MAHTYTPGLKVAETTTIRRRRLLPIAGDVLVREGQAVQAEDVVARTFMPGDVSPVNLANLLSLPPAEAVECLLKKEGERIEAGQVLARSKGLFGLFKSEVKSEAAGTIESVSKITGQLMIRGAPLPIEVRAFLAGVVVEVLPGEGAVIESTATFVQGIFGVGGEAFGAVRIACDRPDQPLTPERISPDLRGAVIVGGARVTAEAIRRAVEIGAAAIVTGGIDDQDLRDFLGYDLGVAVTGSEQLGVTVIITEGFGDIAMAERTYRLLASRAGAAAAVSGATQIRAGVIRPEVVVPWGGRDVVVVAGGQDVCGPRADDERVQGRLEVGSLVRVIREPFFGRIGKVAALPAEPAVLASGSKARVLEVAFATGERASVPRANIELLEG